jgi:PadR family transcriptional regulator PadR
MQSMVVGDVNKLLAQMRKGFIDYCVLALLESGDHYGLEITKVLSEADGLVTSEGTVYPLLTRLRNDGLVETYSVPSNEGPPRRYYHLTKEGHRALAPFREQWLRFRDAVDDILARGQL